MSNSAVLQEDSVIKSYWMHRRMNKMRKHDPAASDKLIKHYNRSIVECNTTKDTYGSSSSSNEGISGRKEDRRT